jgi:hypothetical protein
VSAINVLVLCLHILRKPYELEADTHWETASLLVLCLVTAALTSRASSSGRDAALALLVVGTALALIVRTAGTVAQSSFTRVASVISRYSSRRAASPQGRRPSQAADVLLRRSPQGLSRPLAAGDRRRPARVRP